MSKKILTDTDITTLNFGLSFVPSVSSIAADSIFNSFHRLTRKLKLIDYFEKKDETPDLIPDKKLFTNPSQWTPKSISIETKKTINELREITEKTLLKYNINDKNYYQFKNPKHNLSREQRVCIEKLKNNEDIIIKPADKGGLVCILDKTSYMNEAYRQLNNTKYYKRIDTPRRIETIPKINEIVHRLHRKKFITKGQLDYLSAYESDRERNFYLLPKVHKPKAKWPQEWMPEGRPIVADCGTESRRISDYIDHFLKPLSSQHPSYIKDTYEFISKIRGQKVDKNCLLVTGDITALYTNMNIDRTLEVTKEILTNNPDSKRPDRFLLELLELTMKNNDFRFNNEIFLQIFGTAMGKPYAPSLANIYLRELDFKAMNNFRIKPNYYFRFLDDIFFVWTGTRDELTEFETYLNTLIPDIKITLNVSESEVNFLDTTVFKYSQNDTCTLETRVYFKETDTHQLLHTSSFHPPHTTQGVLKSQVLRFKRLSSFKTDYDKACFILFNSLKKRGYNKRQLRQTKSEIWYYHTEIDKETNINNNLIPIVIPYSPIAEHIVREWKRKIVSKKGFSKFRIIAAYSKHRNIAQLLNYTKPKINNNNNKNSQSMGSFKCTSTRCQTCQHVPLTKRFVSNYTRRSYIIKDTLDCKSHNIIYLINCKKCKKQYVGETGRQLSERLANHKSNIKLKRNTPVASHFNENGHTIQDLSITPIEQIKQPKNQTLRWQRELGWIEELMTYNPFGLNQQRREQSTSME